MLENGGVVQSLAALAYELNGSRNCTPKRLQGHEKPIKNNDLSLFYLLCDWSALPVLFFFAG